MTDIPADILKAAETAIREVCDAVGAHPNILGAKRIAQFLYAERSRCERHAKDAAGAIANRVDDKTVELVFSLPDRIRKGE